MDSARPGRRGRRLSRSAAKTSPHTRLARVGLVVVAPAVLALLFAVSTPGTLPPPPLEPLFDGRAAAQLTEALSTEYPARVPGTLEAEGAARWYQETISSLGLETEEDVWGEDIADLGRVTLRNVVTVVPGRSDETILVLAHRDNAGTDQPFGDNAAGTAALIELAKGFAPQEVGPDPRPNRTLVFVSTDAGIYGGAGAERFARSSPHARQAIAAVVIDGLASSGRPELGIAGDTPATSSRALVTTARSRIAQEAGVTATLPSLATQLADLAMPFAEAEQGRLLASEIAAISISTAEHRHGGSSGSGTGIVSAERLERLGRASEALVDSLDASVGAPFRTPDTLYYQDRALSGWAVRLTLVLLVVPFALGLVDLLARVGRRGLPLTPALRGLRTRLLIWLFAVGLVGVGAVTDVFPTGSALPLPPFTPYVTDPNVAGLGVLAILFGLVWLAGRRRLVPVGPVSPEERLAGLVVALALLGVVAVTLAIAKPYALVFVLPSLYAWLWIEPERPAWRRIGLFAIGVVGPLLGLALVGRELELTALQTPLYVVGLVTVGYVSLWSVLLTVVWMSAALQVGAVAFGRYAPYADGAEPPAPGLVRRSIARAVGPRTRQSSGR